MYLGLEFDWHCLIVKGARSWALTLNLKDAHLRCAPRFMSA
jgi:hypothetical protein